MATAKEYIKQLLPMRLRKELLSLYHLAWAWGAAQWYGHPSRKLFVLGVTGTKGKTTTVELIRAILLHEGYRVATTSTLQFTIDNESVPNTYKMSMPGRGFVQKFLRDAARAGCDYAIIELTSEGAVQHRHRFIDLDAFIFTNLAKEHIESHGSYDAYRNAKLSLTQALVDSCKTNKLLIVNGDDPESRRFMGIHVPMKKKYGKEDAEPIEHTESGLALTYEGYRIPTKLKGSFDVYNALAAITFARSQGINIAHIAKALARYSGTRGRMEYVHTPTDKAPFSVVVDYAHTPDSLQAVYESISGPKICVFGATGGGRDKWKRPEFGRIAGEHCQAIFLTDEDPYDEDPEAIVRDITTGLTHDTYNVIMDRKEAIREAIRIAPEKSTIVITGKGTDPYIMGPNGTKKPWDDATIAKELINEHIKHHG